jgi:plasmid stability protein
VNKVHGNKGKVHSVEWRKKLSESQKGIKNSFFGKHHSIETLQKISKMFKGKPFSEEHRRRISESNKNSLRVKEQLRKIHESLKGKPLTEETKEKLRLANLGKHHSLETKLKMSLARKGKPFTKEHCEKIGQANKGRCVSVETRKKLSNALKGEKNPRYGKHLSMESRQKISDANKLKGHHNWQGGKSFESYTTDWTDTLRRSIRERDNYICQLCGTLQGDYAFSVHHLDYDRKNCNPENLITLCKKCHGRTGYDKEKWKLYFENRRKNI